MKISRDWLSDFIEWIETDPQVIADELTRCMGEVDDVSHQGKYLDGVVVGKVTNLRKHPGADKLSVCDVETDKGTKGIVCGGTNLKEGMHVAFAHVGTTVLAGGQELKLEKVKIRGVDSEGMICAAPEVEIEGLFPSKPEDGNRPVADLTSKGFKVGTPLRKALGLNDVIFYIDNHAITNRADLFSHVGVARELVTMGLATWKREPKIQTPKFPKTPVPFTLKNDVPDLVTAYQGAVLEVDSTAETPDWMKRRLEATGWRSINVVVDITNYVLMEVGMPLHAFDIDDFKGDLVIRKSKKGEKIRTLDDAERALPEGAVIISDDAGIFDLFGVMGGLRTSNKPTTKRIFVQAGVINPVSVRKTIVAMGHRTDAATVYEKGVTLMTAKAGLARAIELFQTLSPSTRIASAPLEWGKETTKKAISVPADVFESFLGVDIKPAQSKKILTDLGFDVKTSGKGLSITPPTWRNDISMKTDLVEEVARIYRYAKVTPIMPDANTTPPFRDPRVHQMRDSLKESGAFELLNLAFTSPQALKKCGLDPATAISIENPIGEDISLMRPSLLPSMLETIARELPRSTGTHLKMYEYGRVFEKGKPEKTKLCLVVTAKGKTTLKDDPLLVAKADIACALSAAGYALEVKKTEGSTPYDHPGRSADLLCQGTLIGRMTEVHPSVCKAFGIENRTATARISMELLKSLAPIPRHRAR